MYYLAYVAIMNRQIVLRVYRRLLTNRLHDKAAELYLANSGNNRLTTSKYIEYINSIWHVTSCITFSITWCEMVKFYCDVITRSHLQLINTSIDTFFSKLRAVLAEQRRRKAGDG